MTITTFKIRFFPSYNPPSKARQYSKLPSFHHFYKKFLWQIFTGYLLGWIIIFHLLLLILYIKKMDVMDEASKYGVSRPAILTTIYSKKDVRDDSKSSWHFKELRCL